MKLNLRAVYVVAILLLSVFVIFFIINDPGKEPAASITPYTDGTSQVTPFPRSTESCMNSGCSEGYTCYSSMICSRGQDCSNAPVEGDQMCHKSCQSDSECPASMPTCSEKEIWHGDYSSLEKFCSQ